MSQTGKGQFTEVSTKLLPMKDIAQLLKYKFGFADMASLGVDSPEELALAHEGERDTVAKAVGLLKTNGQTVSADDLMTAADRELIRNYSMEIRDLRDELYQLKADLGRKGLTTNYDSYAGFHETFDQGDILYDATPIGRIVGGNEDTNKLTFRMDDVGFEELNVGDWIIIKFRDAGLDPALVRVKLKSTENTVHVETSTNSAIISKIKEGDAEIFRSLGQYANGSFAFIRDMRDELGEARYSSFDDGSSRTTKHEIDNPNQGLMTTFYVNSRLFGGKPTGFLTELSVYAKKIGNPGALRAYVFKEEYLNDENPVTFQGVKHQSFVSNDVEHFESRVAVSHPLDRTDDGYERLSFRFQREDGRYNEIEKGRYVFMIVPTDSVSNENKYEIECLEGQPINNDPENRTDLQTNNRTFVYYEPESEQNVGKEIKEEIPSIELHYELKVNEVLDESISPYRAGLYTKRILASRDMESRSARLVMRINREGMFSVDTEDESATFNNALPFTADKRDLIWREYNHQTLKGLGAIYGDKVIIGENYVESRSSMNRVITFDGSILAKKEDAVYRMGYDIQLRPVKVEIVGDEVKTERVIARGEPVKMNLTAVLRDRIKRSPKISDRLLFECEIPEDDGTKYNCFDIQIKWESGYPNGVMESGGLYNTELFGAIQDLSFSLERGI